MKLIFKVVAAGSPEADLPKRRHNGVKLSLWEKPGLVIDVQKGRRRDDPSTEIDKLFRTARIES